MAKNRSTEPNSARWIMIGRCRPLSVPTYSMSKRCGNWKSSWMVDIWWVRPMASRACTEVFGLAEIPRPEEFLDADNLRAFAGGLADAPLGFGEVFIGVERAGHLDEANPELGLLHMTIVAALGIMNDQVHRALVLFDIDGTLLRRAGPHHRAAVVHGVRRVTGLKTTTEGVPVQGMLDPEILTVMMRTAGAGRAAIRQAMPEI